MYSVKNMGIILLLSFTRLACMVKARFDSRLDEPLIAAIQCCNDRVVAHLLQKGANPNATNLAGCPVLVLAVAKHYGCSDIDLCIESRLAIVRKLLEAGAVVDESRALHVAAENDTADFLSVLLEFKADINLQDLLGYTPLHLAAAAGNVEGVKILLSKGARFNEVDNLGDTPLHAAISYNAIGKGVAVEAVKLLCDAGANSDLRNSMGLTPLELAKSFQRTDIVTFLQSRAEKPALE